MELTLDVWIGSMDDPQSTRETYRKGVVTITGLQYCAIDVPDEKLTRRRAGRRAAGCERRPLSRSAREMTKDDTPAAVYSGHEMEALFLKSLLEGSGIPASVSDTSFRGDLDVRVCVSRRDVERALRGIDLRHRFR